MLNLLQSIPDKIQLVTESAAAINVTAVWIDCSTATPPVMGSPGRTLSAIASATTTDIVPTPAAGYIRNVKKIIVANKDASASCMVTLFYNANGTQYRLWKTAIRAGEVLEYVEGVGYRLLTSANAANYYARFALGDSFVTSSTGTNAWFPTLGAIVLPANTAFKFRGLLNIFNGAVAHTTSVMFGGSATLTDIAYYATGLRTTAANTRIATFTGVNSNVATATVFDVSGTQPYTQVYVEGILRVNAGGTFIPQFAFNIAPTQNNFILRGSFFELRPLGVGDVVTTGTWT